MGEGKLTKCWQCKEEIEKEEYCGHCGIWQGDDVKNNVVEFPKIPQLTGWKKFRQIFKSPSFMWLDEFLHVYTNWHHKYDWVDQICDDAEAKLQGEWKDAM